MPVCGCVGVRVCVCAGGGGVLISATWAATRHFVLQRSFPFHFKMDAAIVLGAYHVKHNYAAHNNDLKIPNSMRVVISNKVLCSPHQ